MEYICRYHNFILFSIILIVLLYIFPFIVFRKSFSDIEIINHLKTSLNNSKQRQEVLAAYKRVEFLDVSAFKKSKIYLNTIEKKPSISKMENFDKPEEVQETDHVNIYSMKSELSSFDNKFDVNVDPVHDIIVHLDLKGAPPKPEYFYNIFPLIKHAGATGILIEWEDMFPFDGILTTVRAKNAYSKKDVENILLWAKSNSLSVIPLIQTFGHLEFFLKTEQWEHLREVLDSPQAICPSQNLSFKVIKIMIDQIIKIHYENIKYLHIGCDEVYQLGLCHLCRDKDRDALFLNHVIQIAKYIKNSYNITPLIWHDMLTQISTNTLKFHEVNKWVEPVIWSYAEDVHRFVGLDVFLSFSRTFSTFWGASAFKGAFGETLNVPPIKRHVDNNLSWLKILNDDSQNFVNGTRGLILTGWQRYDHFAVLCEMLPASIPSLVLNTLIISSGAYNESVVQHFFKCLKCKADYAVDNNKLYFDFDPQLWDSLQVCDFPGSQFFQLTSRLYNLQKRYEAFIITFIESKGWLTDYNIRHLFSSPLRLAEYSIEADYLHSSFSDFIKDTLDALKDIYDKYTIYEWLEQKLYPMFKKVSDIRTAIETIRSSKHWPVRPLITSPEVLKIMEL